MKTQKGQFEAMGLAVIVVLVSLGMFFMLFFSLGKESDFVARYDREQMAQNVVDSFSKTNPEGCTADFTDLITDSVILHRNPCGTDSEQLLKDGSKYVLNKTFEEAVPYHFTIKIDGQDQPLVKVMNNCDPSVSQDAKGNYVEYDKPGEQIIPLFPTNKKATIQLILCIP